MECDATKTGIGVVISQCKHPIVYFGENLSGSSLNYNIYDVELMVVVKELQY